VSPDHAVSIKEPGAWLDGRAAPLTVHGRGRSSHVSSAMSWIIRHNDDRFIAPVAAHRTLAAEIYRSIGDAS
jgi:hypothetical protein